eukprot:1157601-Pelagomonas_calceolata.AAC.1
MLHTIVNNFEAQMCSTVLSKSHIGPHRTWLSAQKVRQSGKGKGKGKGHCRMLQRIRITFTCSSVPEHSGMRRGEICLCLD